MLLAAPLQLLSPHSQPAQQGQRSPGGERSLLSEELANLPPFHLTTKAEKPILVINRSNFNTKFSNIKKN